MMMHDYPLFSAAPAPHRPLSVWELSLQIKDLVEAAFPEVWVAGEISNFVRPQSGHCYLTLKDQRAQLRAVVWRGAAARLRFAPQDGLEVVCRGHLDLYPPRGNYQLVIEDMLPKGIGALELALRQLREKLAREGLFDAARKRPLPAFVRHIALVTSPTGAAIHDFLQVLGRRWRGADVLVVPVRVQGEGAAAEIAAAIRTVNRLGQGREKSDSPHLPEKGTVPSCAKHPEGRPGKWGQSLFSAPSTAWWLHAAVAAWRTSGHSTRSRWCGPSPPRGFRWSRPWGMRST